MSEPTLYLDLGCRHLRVCDSVVPVPPEELHALVALAYVLGNNGDSITKAYEAADKLMAGIGGDDE